MMGTSGFDTYSEASLLKIEQDEHIVGFSCTPAEDIINLAILLGKIGEVDVVRKISFVNLQTYPSKDEFD